MTTASSTRDRTCVAFLAGMLESSGGLEILELEIGRGLASRGWKVICAYDRPGDLLEQWQGIAATHSRHDLDESQTLDLVRPADVLYVHDILALPSALDHGRSLRIPTVCHLHLPPYHLRRGLRGRIKGKLRYEVDPSIGPNTTVARFIAVSHHTRDLWVESGLPPERVEVVHNGIDLQRFRPAQADERKKLRDDLGVDDDVFLVGYVGRIDENKGVKELLEAFGSVASVASRRMQLVVIGGATRASTDPEAYLAGLKAASPSGTTWLGKRNDVPELYRAMDLLVMPSQWEEPFGLVAVEAMASGVPVLGTRRGGLTEIMTGPLAENLVGISPKQIAAGIRRHVEDPAHGERVAFLGRRRVEQEFSLETMAAAVERILRAADRP